MKRKKTLHDLTGLPDRPPEGTPIPQVFHSKGPILTHDNGSQFTLDNLWLDARSQATKLHSYSTIAASEHFVPTQSKTGDNGLRNALRSAVGTDLAKSTGILDTVAVARLESGMTTAYHLATEAMQHYGAVQGEARLHIAKTFLHKRKYKMQAKLLEQMIRTGIETAMTGDHEELEMFYQQFHLMYGSATAPNPDVPAVKVEMNVDSDEGIPNPDVEYQTKPEIGEWGNMNIVSIPMHPWKKPGVRSKFSWKYSEFGTFKYPWRALPSSDYQCFSLRRKQYAGTILLDMSGSMNLSATDIDKLLDIAPHATIAGYGAHRLNTGELVIIVANEKRGSLEDARAAVGQRNIVDGPALRWLEKQIAPRIWISDGKVTGVGESQHQNLVDECEAIKRSGKILQFLSIRDLIKNLNS